MQLTLLCNAGLALQTNEAILLVDVPNQELYPFYGLPNDVWMEILNHVPPYDKVCGIWFTHDHPDHLDRERIREYLSKWPGTPVFLPEQTTQGGCVRMGPFVIEYGRIDHAPLPEEVPPHVVALITVEGKTVYVSGDAMLDVAAHRSFLRGRRTDAAVWNSMYLSKPETRALINETSAKNYICHMPAKKPDPTGLWRKVEMNFVRHETELRSVCVLAEYPTKVLI